MIFGLISRKMDMLTSLPGEKKPGAVKLLVVLCVLSASLFSQASSLGDASDVVAKDRHIRQVDPELTRRTFDFSTKCSRGIVLTIGTKIITTSNVRLSADEVLRIQPILYGQTLDERLDVLCRKYDASRRAALSIGRSAPFVYDITADTLFEGDILLNSKTAAFLLGGSADLRPSPRASLGIQDALPGDPNIRTRLPGTPVILGSRPDPSLVARPLPVRVSAQPESSFISRLSLGGQNGKNVGRKKRKIISPSSERWPGAVVPWELKSNTFSTFEQNAIRNGIESWKAKTCVQFPRTGRSGIDSVLFIKSSGCYSYIGKIGGQQDISIGNGCTSLGVVTHEIGHALGLLHEQSRPDRDDYISINTAAVSTSVLGNFLKQSWNLYETSKVPYDYGSVMHYALKDFSITGAEVVVPRSPNWKQGEGQRNDISFWDAKIVNLLYCNSKCGVQGLESTQCENEGYLNPNNCQQCICPPGFAPPTCSQPVQSSPICGTTRFNADGNRKQFRSPSGIRNTDCYYMFTAPEGYQVKVNFINTFQIENPPRACGAFVEVRYQTMTLSGPRFCGNNRPGTFVSHGNTLLVRWFALQASTAGFTLEYQAEPCGGCSVGSGASQQSCLRTPITRCDTSGRENRCFDPRPSPQSKRSCCQGYTLSGTTCFRSGTPPTPTTMSTTTTAAATTTTTAAATTTTTAAATTTTTAAATTTTTAAATTTTTAATTTTQPTGRWSPWTKYSHCSRTCGFCGSQFRVRECETPPCSGSSFQFRRCTETPCDKPKGRRICFTPRPRLCEPQSKFCCDGTIQNDVCKI